MEHKIILNRKIYSKFKDELITTNCRIFDAPNFYNLASYSDSYDLTGITTYLSLTDKVIIYATASFIDFVNILLVLSFLERNNYKNEVEIRYYVYNELSIDKPMMKVKFNNNYADVYRLINLMKDKKDIDMSSLNIPGISSFISFYNLINNKEKLEMIFDNLDYSKESKVEYMLEKYSNMGIDREYYESIF